MAALETSQETQMPSYARLAFVINIAQLLQRRIFVLKRTRAARPRNPAVESKDFFQRLSRFAGLLCSNQLTVRIVKMRLSMPRASNFFLHWSIIFTQALVQELQTCSCGSSQS